MVRSCTQLKGTMIVPLILVETVEEQNKKKHTKESWLVQSSWLLQLNEPEMIIPIEREIWDACFVLCLLWQQLSTILGPIFYWISFYVPCLFCVCVCVCVLCMHMCFFYYPNSSSWIAFCVLCGHLHRTVIPMCVCRRVTKRTLYLCPHCPWMGLSMKYISLCMWACMFSLGLFIPEHVTRGSGCHFKFKFDVCVTLASSISVRWCNNPFLSTSSSCALTRGRWICTGTLRSFHRQKAIKMHSYF